MADLSVGVTPPAGGPIPLGGIFIGPGTSGTISGATGNRLLGNEIRDNGGAASSSREACRVTENALGNVNVSSATGITYVP